MDVTGSDSPDNYDEESWCTDEPVQPNWIVVQASIDDDE